MKTDPVFASDLARSVWAVPPLARHEGRTDDAENRKLTRHIEAGGVTTILWGGNANVYNQTLDEYADLIARIPDWVAVDTWAVPAAGPDHGRLQDHACILRGTGFPTVLALPFGGACDPDGVEAALRQFVDTAEIPVIPYLRRSGYLRPDQLARMLDDGIAVGVKYALEPDDPRADPDLDALLAEVPASKIVSGIGELAAIPHMTTYDLCGFTAGAVCIDPRRSMRVLAALQAGDEAGATEECAPLRPLEDLRQFHGPIPVIHAAVTASGIADMGAIAPMHSMPDPALAARIAEAVVHLTVEVPA